MLFQSFSSADSALFSLTTYPLQNKSGAECIEELTKRLLALGATQSGQFLVDADVFENSFNKTKINVLHNSGKHLYLYHHISLSLMRTNQLILFPTEHPASVFSILDNGQKQIPLISDLIFDLLMLKISPYYSTKKMVKVSFLNYIF